MIPKGIAVFLGPVGQMGHEVLNLLAGGFAKGLGAADTPQYSNKLTARPKRHRCNISDFDLLSNQSKIISSEESARRISPALLI
jgi:hypothetical protein